MSGRTQTVLFVDDDLDIPDLAAEYVANRVGAIESRTAACVPEALENFDDGVDCVVSDYEMPGADGLDLLAELRGLDADVPFILFTGKGSEEIASEAIAAGARDYVPKRESSGFDRLANRVEAALTRARTEHALARLHETTRRMHDAETVADVESVVVDAADEVLGYPLNGFRRYDPATDRLVPTATTEAAAAFFDRAREPYDRNDEAAAWRAFDTGEIVTVGERDARRTGVDGKVYVPVDQHGLLTLSASERVEATAPDRRALEVLAANAASSLDRLADGGSVEGAGHLPRLCERSPDPTLRFDVDGDGLAVPQGNPAFEETFDRDPGLDLLGAGEVSPTAVLTDGSSIREHLTVDTGTGERRFLLTIYPADDTVGYATFLDPSA